MLLRFNSVAVVGASDEPSRIGGRPIAVLHKFGFRGSIYGVNPKYQTVQGESCVANPRGLPHGVELAIFAVPAPVVVELFPQLCEKGIKAAVVFTAGFGEAGRDGLRLEEKLVAMARHHGIAVTGPNCVGTMSFINHCHATFASAMASLPEYPSGNIALLSQSSGFATNIYADAVLKGVRFSHVITTGNEAVLDFADYLDYLVEDVHTKVVLGCMEGLRNGPRFCQAAARLRDAGKPLVLIKTGKSVEAADAVRSHTGLLSGDDAGYQAVFQKYGVIRVSTLEELTHHAQVFALPPLRGGVSVVTTSGGAGVYVADLCAELGVPLTKFEANTVKRLRGIVPQFGVATNPVDLTAQVVNDRSLLQGSFNALFDDSGTGVLLFVLSGQGESEKSRNVIEMLVRVQSAVRIPLVLAWLGVPQQARVAAAEAGLVVFSDPAQFLRGLAHRQGSITLESESVGLELEPRTSSNKANPQIINQDRVMDEWQAMSLLDGVGVATPRRWRASTSAELDAIATSVRYPCVAKLLKPAVAHRAAIGGVVTGINSAEQLVSTWNELVHEHGAETILVAEQEEAGTELLVGAVADATFGQRLVVGVGGALAERIKDSVTLVPPLSRDYILEQLSKLAIWPVVQRYLSTGQTKYDDLVTVIDKIATIAWDNRRSLAEFECNPIIVTSARITAVDALGIRTW